MGEASVVDIWLYLCKVPFQSLNLHFLMQWCTVLSDNGFQNFSRAHTVTSITEWCCFFMQCHLRGWRSHRSVLVFTKSFDNTIGCGCWILKFHASAPWENVVHEWLNYWPMQFFHCYSFDKLLQQNIYKIIDQLTCKKKKHVNETFSEKWGWL